MTITIFFQITVYITVGNILSMFAWWVNLHLPSPFTAEVPVPQFMMRSRRLCFDIFTTCTDVDEKE